MNAPERRNDIPIACNPQVFTKEERDQHVTLAMDVIFRWPQKTEELPDGFLFEYQGDEGLFLKVARFAHDEHRCCPWAALSIEMEPFAAGTQGSIRLRYIAGSAGKAMLAEFIQRMRERALDPAAQALLREALDGIDQITPANKESFYDRVAGSTLAAKVKTACGC